MFLPPGEEIPSDGTDDRLAALVKLLALGRPLAVAQARTALAPVALEDVQATGLVTREGDEVIADYRLVPLEGLLLASDAGPPQQRQGVGPFTRPSLTLSRLTPRGRRRSMLDLGTGSGILALLGAAHCDQVTAIDINPRALMFAGFNARLNDVHNIELIEGDWLEPVDQRSFDLLVSNPPYLVSPDDEFTYRDSGMPGGALTERLCQATPGHLDPDGLAILLCSWPHASEDDWAAAPSSWVAETGCDALVLCYETLDPLDYAVSWNVPPLRYLDPASLRQTVARWLAYYKTTGTGAISFGAVVLRRGSGTPWVSAVKAGSAPGDLAGQQLLRLFSGQDLIHALDDRALLERRFSLPEGINVSQRFQRRQTGFVARPAMVELADGLGVSASVDPDALEVLFACDGQRTLSEIVRRIAERRAFDVAALAQIAAGAAREMLAHGVLEG